MGGKSHVKVQTCKFPSSYWGVNSSVKALPFSIALFPCFGYAIHNIFITEEQQFEPFTGYLADFDQSVGSGSILSASTRIHSQGYQSRQRPDLTFEQ